jgi:ATP-binding cassette, subfamily C, bacterial CydC
MSDGALRELLGDQLTARRLARPAAMTVVSFLVGAALLGLAGWFIAASAVAGLAVASTFSFLFPSAGVQALAWGRAASRYWERITTHDATLALGGSLRAKLFARALDLPRERVADLRSSDLLGRITVDSDAVENLLLRAAFPRLAAVAALLGAAVVFAQLSVPLAIVVAVGLTLTAGVVSRLAHHQVAARTQELVAARARARKALIEAVDGLPELRSYHAERRAVVEITAHVDELARSRRQLARVDAGTRSVGLLLADLTLLGVVSLGAGLLGGERLSAPWFVAACLVAIAAFEPVVALPAAVTARAKGRAASARLTEVFPATPPAEIGSTPASSLTANAIEHLTPGSTVLLTGASGSGKSTLLRQITSECPTHMVAMVAQDAYVFDGTVRENLQLAAAHATDEDLWDALRGAALEDAVAEFPAGLDTPVGPGGEMLSGGQRRRLGVAMGLLRRTSVLLLDEPTEGLDASTAARLLCGVRAHNASTAIVIALHDRQSLDTPWTPTARIELS